MRERMANATWTTPGLYALADWAYDSLATRATFGTPAYLSGLVPVEPERRAAWLAWQKPARSPAEYPMRHVQAMFPRMTSRMPIDLNVARFHFGI